MTFRTHFSTGIILSTIMLGACSGAKGAAAKFQPSGDTVATPPPASGPITLSDIEYGKGATTSDDVALLLDIYQPTDACSANRPTILFLHGGGFLFADKADETIRALAAASNARNLNFVSIQYRTLGNSPVPSPEYKSIADEFITLLPTEEAGFIDIALAATEDTVTALRWMESNADAYCLDMSRLAYWGESSGATTALQVAYGLNQYGITRPDPDVVIDYWGDLYRDTDLEFREAPFLALHGNADQTVVYQSALDITVQADIVSVPYAFYTVEGAEHTFLHIDVFNLTVDGKSLLDITLDFIEAHLIGGTPLYETVNVP